MTQLTLFDAPSSFDKPESETMFGNPETIAPAIVTPAEEPAADSSSGSQRSSKAMVRENNEFQGKRTGRGAIDDHQPGVHQMGDLARLVLLRYDMMAKRRADRELQRRAELAEKRAAENCPLPR